MDYATDTGVCQRKAYDDTRMVRPSEYAVFQYGKMFLDSACRRIGVRVAVHGTQMYHHSNSLPSLRQLRPLPFAWYVEYLFK